MTEEYDIFQLKKAFQYLVIRVSHTLFKLDTELNIDGTKQALSVAQRLRKETFHYIYSSDLKTCVQTTEEIKKKHPDTPVIYDKRLREQNIGDLTGLPWKEAKNILKKNDLNLNSFIANNNGEEISKFIARINEWYADIIFKHLIIPQQEYFDEIDDNTSGLKSKTISAACSPIGTPLSSSRSSSMSSLNSDDSTFGYIGVTNNCYLKVHLALT